MTGHAYNVYVQASKDTYLDFLRELDSIQSQNKIKMYIVFFVSALL